MKSCESCGQLTMKLMPWFTGKTRTRILSVHPVWHVDGKCSHQCPKLVNITSQMRVGVR